MALIAMKNHIAILINEHLTDINLLFFFCEQRHHLSQDLHTIGKVNIRYIESISAMQPGLEEMIYPSII